MPRGGKRTGAGRPAGSPNIATLKKSEAQDALRQIVLEHMRDMADAQIASAKGIKYLVTRNAKTGKFERVSQEQMDALLTAGSEEALERIEVWDKDPSTPAFTDLMNRALGKPAENVALSGELELNGKLEVVTATLAAARKRLASHKPKP